MNDKISGIVTGLNTHNMIIDSQHTTSGIYFYHFPVSEKDNLKITEITAADFIEMYNPNHDPNYICKLIKKNPKFYKTLHDDKKILPKKIAINSPIFNKKNQHYRCRNGRAYAVDNLNRFLGVFGKGRGKGKGGGKKSRKIYKKIIQTKRKTKRKTKIQTKRKTKIQTKRKTKIQTKRKNIKKIYKKREN